MGIAVAGIVFFALLQPASGLDEPASAVAAALPEQRRAEVLTAALEVPDLLVGDVRAFFRELR